MSITVIGHINPDTDTTGSAIAAAWMLNKIGIEATAYRTGTLNKETLYALEQAGLEQPPLLEKLEAETRFALVDTNNPDELLPGWQDATLTGIIDHHKFFGGLKTAEPIPVMIEPVACTATLIYKRMVQHGLEIPKDIAAIMLACILSDTLKFTSPTTTPTDQKVAEDLSRIAGIDIEGLASGMFAAKSDLSGMSVTDILTIDGKTFAMGEKKVKISTMETTNPANLLGMREALEQGMNEIKAAEGLDYYFFFVVDILNGASHLITATEVERQLAEQAFGVTGDEATLHLPGVVSRKKQIVPKFEAALG